MAIAAQLRASGERPGVDRLLARLFAHVVDAARGEIAKGGDWRSVIDGLRPRTQEIWQRLAPVDQHRFFRHVEAFWSAHRHRMPPAVAARLATFRASARLRVLAGRVIAVRKTTRGLTAALRPRGSRMTELLPFDWIVNCTGARQGGVAADPFLERTVARGLTRLDRQGRGIDVGADGLVAGRGGKPTPGLYAVGPLTAGRLLEITAVPEIRAQVAEIAGAVADHLTAVRHPAFGLTRDGSR